jgi:hypothetical protein
VTNNVIISDENADTETIGGAYDGNIVAKPVRKPLLRFDLAQIPL